MAVLPFDPDTLSRADRALYEAMKAKRSAAGAPFDGPYLPLMNHPQLASRIEALGYYLKFQSTLPREVYQFVVLKVARACRVPFEWVDHVDHARAAGVPEQVIEALRTGAEIALPEPLAAAAPVIEAALGWQDVPAAAQQAAIDSFGRQGLVELVVLVGFYQMFSAINQGFAVPLRAGAEAPF
jgi:4-carboxymuconolactone decarboxylase